MAILSIVNEKTTVWLTAAFTDRDGDAVQPTTVEYRIDAGSGDTLSEVLDWTSVTPATSVEIEIDDSHNAIVDSTLDFELRTLTVRTTFGASGQAHDYYEYRVRNLEGVT